MQSEESHTMYCAILLTGKVQNKPIRHGWKADLARTEVGREAGKDGIKVVCWG